MKDENTENDLNTNANDKQKCEEKIRRLFWERYGFYTTEVSKICRQLAFAEGAIIGYFGLLKEHTSVLMLLIIILLIFYFVADILQYIFGAFEHKKSALKYELLMRNALLMPENIQKDEMILKSAEICYSVKLVFLGIASIFLVAQIIFLIHGC